LRAALSGYPFVSHSDTEVLLAAFERWGERCLDRLIGMFAFLVWDTREKTLFAARDRFGVKPLYYHALADGRLAIASELRALHAAGAAMEPDVTSWATYLTYGAHEHETRTFWRGLTALPAGHLLRWSAAGAGIRVDRWYDLAARVGDAYDTRPADVVEDEYRGLLEDTVGLRFRADVPVGINLSGGLDSSTLLGLVHATQGGDSDVFAFTFTTGDERYDELPWVRAMLERTAHPLVECRLSPDAVPALAESVTVTQSEPFGGLPTLAYARVFEEARARGVIVLLDGQGMDEQWAGYDYFRTASSTGTAPIVQGAKDAAVRPDCLTPTFRSLARAPAWPTPFPDSLRNLQYRDLFHTKLPRALRFNDRVSMRSSVELREPFLDHRLVELAMRQPANRKIRGDTGKWMLRSVVRALLPSGVALAPKRPLQTPQREWLRCELASWCVDVIGASLAHVGGAWLQREHVLRELERYRSGAHDNSAFVWQWVSLGLMCQALRNQTHAGMAA
jgi:asparagine synthase (glutamine-hydrolysing)